MKMELAFFIIFFRFSLSFLHFSKRIIFLMFILAPISELKEDEMKKLFLTTGQMKMMASKTQRSFHNFLRL